MQKADDKANIFQRSKTTAPGKRSVDFANNLLDTSDGEDYEVKLVVVGDKGVGKSSLIAAYTDPDNTGYKVANVLDVYKGERILNKQKV